MLGPLDETARDRAPHRLAQRSGRVYRIATDRMSIRHDAFEVAESVGIAREWFDALQHFVSLQHMPKSSISPEQQAAAGWLEVLAGLRPTAGDEDPQTTAPETMAPQTTTPQTRVPTTTAPQTTPPIPASHGAGRGGLTGVRSAVAQTLVRQGVDLGSVVTLARLCTRAGPSPSALPGSAPVIPRAPRGHPTRPRCPRATRASLARRPDQLSLVSSSSRADLARRGPVCCWPWSAPLPSTCGPPGTRRRRVALLHGHPVRGTGGASHRTDRSDQNLRVKPAPAPPRAIQPPGAKAIEASRRFA